MHFTKAIFSLLILSLISFSIQAQEEKVEEGQTMEESNTGTVDKAIDEGLKTIGNLFGKKKKKKKKKGADESDDASKKEESNERYEYEEQELPDNQNVYEEEENENPDNQNSYEDVKIYNPEDYKPPVIEEEDAPFVPNDFIASFTNNMTFYKNGKEQEKNAMAITLILDRDKTAMKLNSKSEGTTSLVVFNNKERSMTTIPDVNGVQGIKMKQRKIKQIAEDAVKDTKVTATDDYKTINNRRCRKYLVEDKEYDSTVWVAQDIDLDYGSFMNKMFGSKGQKQKGGNFSAVTGVPMESHGVSKNGKEEYRSIISDLSIGKIDRSIFDLSKYNIMSLPSFGN